MAQDDQPKWLSEIEVLPSYLGPLWESHHGLRWKVVAATFMNIEDVWYIWPLSKMVSYNKNHWAFSHPAVKWGTFDHVICGYPPLLHWSIQKRASTGSSSNLPGFHVFFFLKRLYRLYIWLDLQPAMWFCWMGMCFNFLWNCFFVANEKIKAKGSTGNPLVP